MGSRGGATFAVAILVMCLVPPVASAGVRTAKGKTSQGKRASALIRDDNSVERVTVWYRATCRGRVGWVRGGVYWTDGPKEPFARDGERFSNGGRTTVRSGPARLVIDMSMNGAPAGPGVWAGKFRIVVRVKNRRGRTLDTCRTRVQTWRVRLPAG